MIQVFLYYLSCYAYFYVFTQSAINMFLNVIPIFKVIISIPKKYPKKFLSTFVYEKKNSGEKLFGLIVQQIKHIFEKKQWIGLRVGVPPVKYAQMKWVEKWKNAIARNKHLSTIYVLFSFSCQFPAFYLLELDIFQNRLNDTCVWYVVSGLWIFIFIVFYSTFPFM